MPNDPDHIPCWQRLDAQTTTSGRLSASHMADLAALGVRHVINLALEESPGALAGEADLLSAKGIAYSHIPVPFGAPDEAQFAQFCRAYAECERPVHVHCIMNWRVSAFFYRYNRAQGMDEAAARALMEQQWQPESNASADAPVWAEFIARQSY